MTDKTGAPPVPDYFAERERQIREILDLIRRQHEAAAKPYVDELVRLYDMRSPAQIVFPFDGLSADIAERARRMGHE